MNDLSNWERWGGQGWWYHTLIPIISDFNFLFDSHWINDQYRQEKLDVSSSSSQAKLVGTLVSISGALIVTLYKGPSIWTSAHSRQHLLQQSHNSLKSENWALGAFFLATASLSASIWNTLQVKSMIALRNRRICNMFLTQYGGS